MTKKLLTSPLLSPSPTSPDPGDGVLRSKINIFSSTASTQPNTTKDICTRTPCADPGIFCPGGGGEVQAPQLILQFKEGVQWFYYTFTGGGVQLFPGMGVQ